MSEVKLTKKQEQQQRAAKARASRVEMLERQLAEARAKEAERNVGRIETKAAELAKSINAFERQAARVELLQSQFIEMVDSIQDEFGVDRAADICDRLEQEFGIPFVTYNTGSTPAQAEARVDAETDAENEQPTLFELPEEGPTPESLEAEAPKKRRGKTATV